jgi:hypothetical protein
MENSKLFMALETLTKDEMNQFGDFIRSPYFNKSHILIKLFEHIKPYHPDYDDTNLTREKIFSVLYPEEEFKDKKLRDMFSKMLDLLEEFFMLEDFRNYPLETNRHILNQYSIRKLDKHFEGLSKETTSLLEMIKIKDSDYYFNTFNLKKDIRGYNESKTSIGRRGELNEELNTEIHSFMIYFIYKMLRYYIEQINQQKLYRHEVSFEFSDEISGYLKSRNFDNEPQIKALYYCLQMLKSPENMDHYKKLKKMLNAKDTYLNKEDLKLIYIQVYNYTRERYLEGKEEFHRESFEIIKKMLDQDIYPREQGYMTSQTFIIFVSVGLQVKEFKWVDSFLEEYINKVAPSGNNNAYNYSKAIYCYRRNKLNDALSFLNKVKIEDFYFYLRVKNQQSRIYFEQGEFDSLLSLLDSLKHYLVSTDTIPEYISERYISYASFLTRVVNAHLSGDKQQMKKILNDIAVSPIFENKSWLLEKVLETVNPA